MDFKKVLLILCFFVSLNTVAQNRLEFNRIVSLSGSVVSGQIIQLDTVPVGKAYKITSFTNSYLFIGICINNLIYPNNQDLRAYNFHFPIWLKEGDVLGVQDNSTNGSTSNMYHISAIEFNIVTD